MSDTPDRVSADDVRGLRTETGRLATSIETLAARQNVTDTTIKQKADKSQVDSNTRLVWRANINSTLAVIAVALVLIVFFADWNGRRVQHNRDARDAVERRAAFCRSLDDLGSIGGAWGNAVLDTFTEPRATQAIAAARAAGDAGIAAAVAKLRQTNGYPADCVFPSARQENVPVWMPVAFVIGIAGLIALLIFIRRRRPREV